MVREHKLSWIQPTTTFSGACSEQWGPPKSPSSSPRSPGNQHCHWKRSEAFPMAALWRSSLVSRVVQCLEAKTWQSCTVFALRCLWWGRGSHFFNTASFFSVLFTQICWGCSSVWDPQLHHVPDPQLELLWTDSYLEQITRTRRGMAATSSRTWIWVKLPSTDPKFLRQQLLDLGQGSLRD